MQIPPSRVRHIAPFEKLASPSAVNPNPFRNAIRQAHRSDETSAVQALLSQLVLTAASRKNAQSLARKLVQEVRRHNASASGVSALMQEFSLSSEEGVALMCLAEALLRIPDHQTVDKLIADKIGKGDWQKHLGASPSLFVNAASWGLMLTGKLVATHSEHGLGSALARLIAKGGEPLIRKGLDIAMRMLGDQFVKGQTIAEALHNSRDNEARGYVHSYDMLGEAALTAADAEKYFAAYENAIHAIGHAANGRGIKNGPGISIKLSALHPRYTYAQRERVMEELLPRVRQLVQLARQYNIGINIDAEESERLELSLDLLEALVFDQTLAGFDGTGFVVQAYQKRCPFVIDFLIDLAQRSGRKLMVRLVKGAYWDSEIKRAQVDGMSDYPVYTRKVYTDLSYLLCAQKLLAANVVIYPQFATHNALTFATIKTWAQERGITDLEFQCLHGMGENLYDQVVGKDSTYCRIYAPVGSHQTLLPYLVRRLLENGANSSFVHQIADDHIDVDTLLADPIEAAAALNGAPHPRIPLPADLFGNERKNSEGMDLSSESVLQETAVALRQFSSRQWQASPLLHGENTSSKIATLRNPADPHDVTGQVIEAGLSDVETALANATAFASDWQNTPPSERATILCRAADLLQLHRPELMALVIREAGKTLPNAVAEVREAIDFLRYYAAQMQNEINAEIDVPALGVVLCISPWNFPLAVFIGQISAALAAGNVVLAKPAEQTPLIACRAVELLYEAGIPRGALQCLPGPGEVIGAALVADHRVRGVMFTGSIAVAQQINRTLAQRMNAEVCDIPLIAETGGQNAMIVDSSALPEQVVQDVIMSAFDSAGQRCSALRVLCLQEEIADHILALLQGAMQELRIGRPDNLATDIGPVIDAESQKNLQAHVDKMKLSAPFFYALPLDQDETKHGHFFSPTIIEINALSELQHEIFGPVLHVLRYRRGQLPQLVAAINASGFGLTLGLHTRIEETMHFIADHAHVGNIYVNRNMVGAVVGVQPFGGEGKSGTGPKAGGPLYLKRLQRTSLVRFAPAVDQHPLLLPALDALIAWAGSQGHLSCVAIAEQYRRDSLLGLRLDLWGPTGESNSLSFAPRGLVLCAANDLDSLINQLAAVFATGNTAAVLRCPTSIRLLNGLSFEALDRIRCLDDITSLNEEYRFALTESAQAQTLRLQLPQVGDALNSGALIQVIETSADGIIPVWRLTVERTLCINTTAAGGNASLMTLDESL